MPRDLATAELNARRVFDRLQRDFAHLEFISEESEGEDGPEIEIRIPEQSGLAFQIWLNLTNSDELVLSTDGFGCEWFPCNEDWVVERYYEAVSGLLDGTNRIVEFRAGKNGVRKSYLERSEGDDWHRIGTYLGTNILLLFARNKHKRVVRNTEAKR